jgi:hypothetical protein
LKQERMVVQTCIVDGCVPLFIYRAMGLQLSLAKECINLVNVSPLHKAEELLVAWFHI